MDDSVFEFTHNKKVANATSYLRLTWRTVLAGSAALDFMATVLPSLLRAESDEDEEPIVLEHAIWEEYEIFGQPIPDSPWGVILKFLNRNCGKIGFCFSMVWFIEAFLDATRIRDRTLRQRDRKRLLQWQKDVEDDDVMNLVDDFGYLDNNYDSWVAFYLDLLWQLMLLPVGFYMLLSQGVYHISLLDGDDTGVIESKLLETYYVEELTGPFSMTRDKNLALGVALTAKLLDTLKQFLEKKGIMVTQTISQIFVKQGLRIVRKVIGSAVRRPRQFATKMKKTLSFIRWFRYLQPIIGTSNKLKGNLVDLFKKLSQRQAAAAVRKLRQSEFQHMTEDEQAEYAALKIQSLFRAYQVRRKVRAMKILRGQTEVMAAIKMQAIFRQKVDQARLRLRKKKMELEMLEAKAKMDFWKKAEFKKTSMTPRERMRLYQLEDQLHKESARVLNQRMLLRPNTRFDVVWKILFCICVIFEMAGLIANPHLKKHTDDISGKPLTVHKVVENLLVPRPLEDLYECTCASPKKEEGWKSILFPWRAPSPPTCDKVAWYCEAPYSTARSHYARVMQLMIDKVLLIPGMVVFLDVPIFFFTGEYNLQTGSLEPKPFFVRWIMPGLLLHLLVNPQMASTSEFLGTTLQYACDIGPVRVWRWTLAFFYPLFISLFTFMEQLWMIIVQKENHQTVLEAASKRTIRRFWRLQAPELSRLASNTEVASKSESAG